ncbi:MAG: glutamine amidotransferase [Kiritimatiellae bacterium]|nr:glutamine amidotransferase [Kiritimatiellia bacterium]
MLRWHAQLSPVVSSLILSAVAGCGLLLYGRIMKRMSRRRTILVLIPKIGILVLLTVALFDPAWARTRRIPVARQLMIITDTSSSMDVRDSDLTRAERAARIADEIERLLHGSYRIRRLEFDTELREANSGRPPGSSVGLRGTDLGGCLLTLAEKTDLSPETSIVLLTDGGDEPVEAPTLPAAALHVVAMGTDPAGWNDIALSGLEHPASVEKGVDFEVQAEVTVRNPAEKQTTNMLRVTLERREGETWRLVEEKKVRSSGRLLRVAFRTNCPEAETYNFRLSVAGEGPEMSVLNNQRLFEVEARRKLAHVLYFTRELGAEFKMIRNELGTDPGLTFTALFRTIGERFTVQGERLEGDGELEAGFPTDTRTLLLYDCIILGSFPASEWNAVQMEALVEYVRRGGAVIFLGGESSFDLGNYGSSPLAVLVPWEMTSGEKDLVRGELWANIPDTAWSHPIMTGLHELVGGRAVVSAVNRVGALKPGAVVLMNLTMGGRVLPLIVLQRYGQGTVLAIATNTLWKWARESPELQKAYGLFWRQAVRNLCGREEGGRVLSVRWDRSHYRPGEQAVAEIRVAGRDEEGGLDLNASITTGGESRPLPVEPVQGVPGTWNVRVKFRERGVFGFRLTAQRQGHVVETYEKAINVGPALPEGSRLEPDHRFLASLAERGGGMYVRETEVQELVGHLRKTGGGRVFTTETPVVSGRPWFAIALLTLWVAEWIIRRSLNLL